MPEIMNGKDVSGGLWQSDGLCGVVLAILMSSCS